MENADFDIGHLAELARLNLAPEEAAHFHMQLGDILGYVDQLRAIETDGVAETAQVTGLINILREDVDKPEFNQDSRFQIPDSTLPALRARRDKLLSGVPERESTMVKVPAILSEG